ncbi:hypothetical protein SNEBB_000706 [Seison nebaliae]|nr:hypothetical protein SNEBB_000706 [Seison nebaliae]
MIGTIIKLGASVSVIYLCSEVIKNNKGRSPNEWTFDDINLNKPIEEITTCTEKNIDEMKLKWNKKLLKMSEGVMK